MRKSPREKDVKTILSPEAYEKYLSSLPPQLPPRYRRLSFDQLACIYAYSTHEDKYSFAETNRQLRKGFIKDCRMTLICKIQSALRLIDRDYSRKVYYRYLPFPEKEVRKNLAVGNFWAHPHFTSVSALNKNFTGKKCNVLMRITAVRRFEPPAYIAPIAWRPAEEEFLFEANSYFRVLRVREPRQGEFDMELLEHILP